MQPVCKAIHFAYTIALVVASLCTLGVYSIYYLGRYTRIHLHTKGMTLSSSPFNNSFITQMRESDMDVTILRRPGLMTNAGCQSAMAAPACECLYSLFSKQYNSTDLVRVQKASLGCLLSTARPIEQEQLDAQHSIYAVNIFTLILVWNSISMAASFIGTLAHMKYPQTVMGSMAAFIALIPVLALAYMAEMGSRSVILYCFTVVTLSIVLYTLLVLNANTPHTNIDPVVIVLHAQTTVYWAQYCAVLAVAFACCNSVMGRWDATYHTVCMLFALGIGTAAAGACLLNMVPTKTGCIASVAALACLLAPAVLYSLPFPNQMNLNPKVSNLHIDSSVWYATLVLLLVPQLEHRHCSSDLQSIMAQGYRSSFETIARIIVTVAAAMDLAAM